MSEVSEKYLAAAAVDVTIETGERYKLVISYNKGDYEKCLNDLLSVSVSIIVESHHIDVWDNLMVYSALVRYIPKNIDAI
jgi:hypothetical protein